jgi:hypothetical protein
MKMISFKWQNSFILWRFYTELANLFHFVDKWRWANDHYVFIFFSEGWFCVGGEKVLNIF